jgi:hypothetical protein
MLVVIVAVEIGHEAPLIVILMGGGKLIDLPPFTVRHGLIHARH